MSCILCLESPRDSAVHIGIFSEEGQQLDALHIINQHFWFNLQTDNNTDADAKPKLRSICRECWQALYTFHEFYLRVEAAHKVLVDVENAASATAADAQKVTASLRTTEAEKTIKVESVEVGVQEPLPRRRGRPRKNPLLPDSSSIISCRKRRNSIKLCQDADETRTQSTRRPMRRKRKTDNDELWPEDIIQELAIGGVKVEVDSEDNHNSKTPHDADNEHLLSFEELSVKDVKDEAADADRDSVDRDAEDNCEPFPDAPENEFSDCESVVKQRSKPASKPKREFSQKMLVSRQFDEFIAANFNLACCLCYEPLSDFNRLKRHFRAKHNTRGYVRCCGKKLLKRGLLVDHIHMHQNPSHFKCPQCEKSLADRRSLELHLKGHEDSRARIYHCQVCSKSFYRQAVFQRHILLHLPNEMKKIHCPQCDKVFATKYTMNQHLKLVHLNMYKKICEVCGISIRGREALLKHQAEHEGVPRPTIQCELCGVTLKSKYGLARHIKTMHTEENLKPQVCNICNKVLPSMSAFKRHRLYMHSMQRKHACPMCDKAFKRPNDLREHMTTHTGEVLYTCPHCPKTFNSNANMHSHRKKMHRKEWEEKRQQRFNTAQNAHAQSATQPDALPKAEATNTTSSSACTDELSIAAEDNNGNKDTTIQYSIVAATT